MTILVYVIDVVSATISEHCVRRAETERALSTLLNAPRLKKLRTADDHVVIFAEYDRRRAATSICFIDGILIPGIGNLVIAGSNGDTLRGPATSIDDFANRVEFTRPMLDPVRLTGVRREIAFEVRFVRQKAAVKPNLTMTYPP